ncbi:Hypothetical_protein [Hexamita inflata]|uniref:Hypothetical_protein n=1 Tax=Hexamita inflata TaxID=28002 RepID=A0AA86N971_9EUKA|nr:Hypothetical protein HINF_LOCUS2770 [Hexamita inflata]
MCEYYLFFWLLLNLNLSVSLSDEKLLLDSLQYSYSRLKPELFVWILAFIKSEGENVNSLGIHCFYHEIKRKTRPVSKSASKSKVYNLNKQYLGGAQIQEVEENTQYVASRKSDVLFKSMCSKHIIIILSLHRFVLNYGKDYMLLSYSIKLDI